MFYNSISLVYFFWFIVGTILASFVGVVVSRFPSDGFKSTLAGRSLCDNCRHKLNPLDLIPIISFISTLGKCRYCHQQLSWRYPLGELIFGLLAVAVAYKFKTVPLIAINLTVILVFFIIAGIDWLTKTVVENVVIIGLALVLVNIAITKLPIQTALLGALVGGGLFALLVGVSRGRWMGAGDIEIGALIGLWLGYPIILVSLMTAFVTGAGYGLVLIGQKKAGLKSQVPFGPFLVLGALAGLFFGKIVVKWYWG